MEYKKAKWEREFEELKSLDIKAEIDALKTEKDADGFVVKRVGPEGEAKREKLEAFMKNKGQIENLLAYRDKLRGRIESLKQKAQKQQKDAGHRIALKNAMDVIDNEHKLLTAKRAEIDNKLKGLDRKSDEYAKLLAERKPIEAKIAENDERFVQVQNSMNNLIGKPVDNKDYTKEMQSAKKMVSKCNMVCRNLMEGKSWEDISVSLSEWKDRKFTSKDEKLSERGKEDKGEKAKTEIEEPTDRREDAETGREETGITKKSRFNWLRHPVKTFKNWMERKKEEKAERKAQKAAELKDGELRNMDVVGKEVEFFQKIATGPIAFRQNEFTTPDKGKEMEDEGR